MSGRYGQLTYTSFDASGTAGGWQVKEVSGGIAGDSDEVRLLVAGVRTVLDPVEPLPDYPDAAQVDRLPRRLAYQRLDEARAAYWHTVPAGVDSTGRPGNVFAHAVIDRMPSAAGVERPIQRWHAPGWLRPFGPDAVTRAQLPVEAPAPADAITRDGVIAFALDTSTWRLGTLFGLLDAVATALDGGPPVVLGVESPDSAAQWIGLVSFLMSAGTAARLNFSTFDRADQVHLAVQAGQHLTAVPASDLSALPRSSADVVVIDETSTLSLGEYGGQPHRTEAGQPIDVTAWSAMAQVVLLDAQSAATVLADVDAYAAQVGDRDLHPAWPMAMSVLARDEFADARDEAKQLLAIRSPRGLVKDSDAGRALADALADLVGTSTADAWQAVQSAPAGGEAADHANRTYLLRALADDAWLGQPGPIPVAPRGAAPPGQPPDTQLAAAVGAAIGRARAAGPERLLRLVDFLTATGLGDGRIPLDAIPEVAAALGDPRTGPELVNRLRDRVGPGTRMAAATATLHAARHRDGSSTVHPDVLAWFADGLAPPRPAELARAQPWDVTWMRGALRGALAELTGPKQATDVFLQLWWLGFCQAPRFAQLAASRVWDPTELLLAAGGTGTMLGKAALPTVLGLADSQPLRDLASVVMKQSPDRVTSACAATRVFDPGAWVQQGNIERQQVSHVPLWDQGVDVVGAERVHADFATWLTTVAAVAALSDLPAPQSCSKLASDAVTRGAAAGVAAMAEAKLVPATGVLANSLVRASLAETAADAGDTGPPRHRDPLDDVLSAAADTIAAATEFTDEDEEAIAALVGRLSGADDTDTGVIKRNRKTVHKFIARHKESQSSLAARMWGKS